MENDPLYQEGLKHFGLGEWNEAVACFTQLQTNYPDDARIKQFLDTAQLRAAATPRLEREAQAQTRSKWAQRLAVIGIIVIIALIAGGVVLAYQTWVVPVQAENARLARLENLRRAAETQIAAGDYAGAIQSYQTILADSPNDPSAGAGLTRAQTLDQLLKLYTQATQAINNNDQAQAVQLLEQISAINPNYRDVNSLLAQIKSGKELTQQFDAAVSLQQASKWQDAAQAFEQIRSTDPSFKSAEITDYLFDDYLQLANQQVAQAKATSDIQTADGLFQKALAVKPLDPRANDPRQLTSAFLDGAAAYQIKDWDNTIRYLLPVYQKQSDYFGGQVDEWLYEAFLTTGQAFLAKGDPFSARDRFVEAIKLAPSADQKAAAQKLYDQADALTTPTPTPRPSPSPLPAGYIAPSWTRRPTGTPNPYPFQLVNTTYLPNTVTGEGCRWAGVAGRIYDRDGSPLVLPTLGVRVTGPVDQGAAAGSNTLIGESGWLVQFDVVPKHAQGFIQVFYKDQPVSDVIPWETHKSCFENMMIMDVQLVKPLPK